MSSIEPAPKHLANKKNDGSLEINGYGEGNPYDSINKLPIAISEVDPDQEVNSPKLRKNQYPSSKKVDEKSKLKKSAFDQELTVLENGQNIGTLTLQQTGRFESGQHSHAKSANQAKALSIINKESPHLEVQDFENRLNLGENENEMRETSYFKANTDEEERKHKKTDKQQNAQDVGSLTQLISISNQHESQSRSNKPADVSSTKNETEIKRVEKRASGFGSVNQEDGGTSDNSNTIKQQEGIQMFKISSKSQMKARANRASRKSNGLVIGTHESQKGDQPFGVGSPLNLNNFDASISPTNMKEQMQHSLKIPKKGSFLKDTTIFDADALMRSQSFKQAAEQELHVDDDRISPLALHTQQKTEIKLQKHQVNLVVLENKGEKNINQKELLQIKQNQIQQQKNVGSITGNFGAIAQEKNAQLMNGLNITKQQSQENQQHNYSVLKGPNPRAGPPEDDETEISNQQQQMFTSMSDIGFPNNIHKQNIPKHQRKTGELITSDRINKMMDTQNNWRVRTMTIDEMLHDIKDRIETDKEYIVINSEKLLDFFLQLLTDQNFKIVLNTLNIINMIVGIKEQMLRFEKITKQEVQEPWGLSNATLGRHIPQIVKKLADSKNIIRQEAIKCLFNIGEIMKSGSKKENNFIALILPYLNNSSNWHIREELLNLLIKSFLRSTDTYEFDSYQILDSILQLFNDNKEKIRNLALEAIAAFASIGYDTQINEVLFQMKIGKDICDLIQSRLEYGMFPCINQDGNVEIPYQNENANYDVDSVAHNMSQQQNSEIRRKQSIGGNSSVKSNMHNITQGKNRGNSSGRKIVVTTAKAPNNQHGIQNQDEMIQQFINNKRTASANNPNLIDQQQFINEPGSATMVPTNQLMHDPTNSFNYSVGVIGNNGKQDYSMLPMFDDLNFPPQDLNGSSFLPQLSKFNQLNQGGPPSYQSQHYQHKDRNVGSSGAPQGLESMWDHNFDPNQSGYQHKIPISGSSRRSNKYLHGTPGQQQSYQQQSQYSAHHRGTNLNSQFQRGNSGKMSSHNMNNSISNQSPSMFQPRVMGQDMMLTNEQLDMLSNGGTNYAQYQQTPGSSKEQILLSAGGFRGSSGSHNQGELSNFTTLGQIQGNFQNQMGLTPPPHIIHPTSMYGFHHSHQDSGIADPGFIEQQQEMMMEPVHSINGRQYQQQQIIQQQMSGVKKNNQNTFYSDGTNFTAQTAQTQGTATTGATSKVAKKLSRGPTIEHQQNVEGAEFEIAMKQGANNIGPGPVKATRAIMMNQNNIFAQEDLCIDTRDRKSKSTGKNMKIKLQNSQQVHKLKQEDESDDDYVYNRSFSHNEKETGSSNLRQSNAFLDKKIVGAQDDPALITQSSKIKYECSDQLQALDNPVKEFKKCMQGIMSPDWFVQFEACNNIRRVCKHHQSLILQGGNLHNLVNTLLKLADSLRSAVSRIALMTIADMFQSLKRVMEPCLLPIVKILLKRGSDTNKFIANEAEKGLQFMVEFCQESKVLQIIMLQNSNSQSNLQRLKICQCLLYIVKSLGNNILFFKENDKLLVQLAKYLQDASQDVRQVSKSAFIAMSQAIMGQNELEKLLQRVLNDKQYQKVKEYLDKEPIHLISNHSHGDFLITNANKVDQAMLKKSNRNHKASIKNLRNERGGLTKSDAPIQADQMGLKIESKSILNPAYLNKNESQGFLNRVAQQQNRQYSKLDDDQQFSETIKDLILKSQVNEWKLRLESSEALFEVIKENLERFQNRQFKMVELADALCKLLTDQNVKIQICCLENFNKIFPQMFQFVENFIQLFYKSIITNLCSSHTGVRKNSEQILKQINDNFIDKTTLLQPLISMIQYTTNARLKPALIDQLIDLLEYIQEKECQQLLQKNVLPVAFKLLDDNKNEIKIRVEKLIKKLHVIIGQVILDQCPQIRLQRVCDICLGGQSKNLNGTGSSGKNSQGQTGNFGANGNQLQLNSRI